MVKKFFIFLLLGIFLLSFTSAITWDNVAYYKLDEQSGTTIADATGNYPATASNARVTTGYLTGKINTAVNFSLGNDIISSDSNVGITGTQSRTLSFWVKFDTLGTQMQIAGWGNGTPNSGFGLFLENAITTNHIYFYGWGGTNDYDTGYEVTSANTWYHLAVTYNSTHVRTFVNGVETSTSNQARTLATTNTQLILGKFPDTPTAGFNGSVDEVGIWNRTLSSSEITELYNSGNGLAYVESQVLSITLVSPTNGTTISDVGTNFTVQGSNLSSVAGTWENLTYYVWDNNTLLNETTVTISSGETFNETLFIDDFTLGVYQWNALACYSNTTSSYCVNASSNNTLTVSLYTLISQGYVNETISGTLETFNLSIQLLSGYELTDANFYYDGERRTPNIVAEDNNRFVIVSNYQIPLTSVDVNNSFYWELEFNGNTTLNTDNKTQLARAMFLDNCASYTNRIFNLSLYDEQTQNALLGDIELIYNILNANYETIETYNFSIDNVSSTFVCSALNLSSEDLYYSAEIRYTSDGYESEFYNIQRAAIGMDTQQINLYDLNSSSSTSFKVTYQDSTFNFVEGAIVQLQRKYIAEDAYEVVEAPLTSSEGVAVLHIDLDSVKYKATVVKNGVLLDTFDNLVFVCESELTGDCEIKLLGEINPQNSINLDSSRDFAYSVSPEADGVITITFSIPSGVPASVNIQLIQTDQFGNETLCNKTVTSSAGSIQCTYNETIGDSYLELRIYKDGEPMAIRSYIIPEDSGLDFLGNNFFIVFVLLLSLVGMGISSPEWMIVNGVITFVIAGSLWLVNGLNFVMGLGGLLWLVIGAGIMIFKLTKQEDR